MAYLFKFVTVDGSEVNNNNFDIRPVNYPVSSGSYLATGDILQYTGSPQTLDLISNLYKVELNRTSSNDWYVNLVGSSVTASAGIVSGSYTTASLSTVTFRLIDHVRNPEAVKSIDIEPVYANLGWQDSFVIGDKITLNTDTTGVVTTTLVPAVYDITFHGDIKLTKFRILPSGICDASDVVVTTTTVAKTITPKNQANFGYTAAASDGRYVQLGGAIDSASYSTFSETALTASYALNGGGSGGTTLITGSTYPITASWSTYAVNWDSSSLMNYIDNLVKNTTFYLTATASAVPSHYTLATGSGATTAVISTGSIGDSVYAFNFITNPDVLENSILKTGVYSIDFYARKTTNPGTTQLTAELYLSDAAGVNYYELPAGQTTAPLTTTFERYQLNVINDTPVTMSMTDRLCLRFKTTSTVSNTLEMQVEGNTLSHVDTPLTAPVQTIVATAVSASWASSSLYADTASYLSGSTAIVNDLTTINGAVIGGKSLGVPSSNTVQIGASLNGDNDNFGAVIIGSETGRYATTSSNAVLIGYQTGYNAVNLYRSIVIGSAANNKIKADTAVILGDFAGNSAMTASNAIMIGIYAGNSCTRAANSIILGRDAGVELHDATNATIVGYQGAAYASDTTNATLMGYNVGAYSGNITESVILGGAAGQNASNAAKATMVGGAAGQNAANANYSTFIGNSSDALNSGLNVQKSIAIGYNAKVSASNTCVIGGTGADAVKVTIGGTSAVNTLDVVGNISCSVITASLFNGTASYALNGGSGGTTLTTGSTYPITASVAISSSYSSITIVQSLNTTQSMIATQSLYATSSISASYALSASYAPSKWIVTGSTYPITASISISSSYALSASYSPVQPSYSASVSTFFGTKQNVIVTGSSYNITASRAITASYALNGGTTLSTGSTYPITASVAVTSSFLNGGGVIPITKKLYLDTAWIAGDGFDGINFYTDNGNIVRNLNNNGAWNGNLTGTASYAVMANSASHSGTASYADYAVHAYSADVATWADTAGVADEAYLATTASLAITASYALNGGGSGTTLSTGSTYPITASWSDNVNTASSFVMPTGSQSWTIRVDQATGDLVFQVI